MAQIKVTVADDDGEIIGIHDYDLAKGLDTLSKMEGAIEELRPQMLSDINKDLLAEEQKVFQKTKLVARANYAVKIKTINGSFSFGVNRYEMSYGVSNWLKLTRKNLHKHHESELLQAFAYKYATCLS